MAKTRRTSASTDPVPEAGGEEMRHAEPSPPAPIAANGIDTSSTTAKALVNQMMLDASITSTKTKDDWCLRQGLLHVISVDDGRLKSLVQSQGPPGFYHSLKSCRHEPTDNIKAPENCFQSLCRIIAGQQLAGKAAQSIWKRLLATTNHNLAPSSVLDLAGKEGRDLELALQKPAGLSRAKARSILDLARHFECQSNKINEEFLSNPQSTEEEIREALLQVKGLGPWSCDMFLMFHVEKSNVFPFGDLGVRKGVAKVFQLKGKGAKGSLCQKKDFDRVCELVKPYRPYHSLFTYYMWRAADIKDVYDPEPTEEAGRGGSPSANEEADAVPSATTATAFTPNKTTTRKRKARTVTP